MRLTPRVRYGCCSSDATVTKLSQHGFRSATGFDEGRYGVRYRRLLPGHIDRPFAKEEHVVSLGHVHLTVGDQEMDLKLSPQPRQLGLPPTEGWSGPSAFS